jgi:transcriptional regulator with XRE-family HTH domain
MQESLGRRLRLMRAERGLSLREAARRAGVVKETISEIERGKTHPYDVTLAKLAKAYDVPLEELLEEEPVPLGEAPGMAGRPSIIDVAWDAARRQVALEKGGGEIAGAPNIVDQRHENEAARRLREEYGLDGNDAEALVNFARERALERWERARLEEEIAMLRDRLQEREQAHS